MIRSTVAILTVAMLAVAASVRAWHTESVIDDSVAQFSQGDLTTSTLTNRGFVKPPRDRQLLSMIDADVVWDIEEVRNTRYLATGHEGKLFSQEGSKEAQLVKHFDASALYALEPNRDGGVFAGASPGGIVYTVNRKGEVEEFAHAGQDIIWDIVRKKKTLYIATGTNAAIVEADDKGTTKTLALFPGSLNVLDLEPIPGSDDLVAAAQGPGVIARVTPEGKVTVLLDPGQEEVRRVAVLPDGSIVGAVNGTRSPGEKLLERTPDKGKAGGNGKPRPASFIARIYPDGFAEEWWTSPESPIHDLYARKDGSVIVSAGNAGRLFEVTPDAETDYLGMTDQQFVTRLYAADGDRVLLGAGAEAALYEMAASGYGAGIYESRIHDARGTVRWGRITGGVAKGGGNVRLSIRTGNTKDPDETWYDWSEAIVFTGEGVDLAPPVARFAQYQLEFDVPQRAKSVPAVDYVRLFYTRPNTKPVITELAVSQPGQKTPWNALEGRVLAKPNSAPAALEISWKSEDADGDTMEYAVYLAPIGTADWTLVEDQLSEPKYTLETRTIADGEYRIRVTASDASTNIEDDALKGEYIGDPILIDNTAPKIIVRDVERKSSDEVRVSILVDDGTSIISHASWRSGYGDDRLLLPEDGASDELREEYSFTVSGKEAQRKKFLTISATDAAGNTTVERIVLD